MPDFPTHGVLGATTDILMGDIGAVYAVFSFLIDRPVFTHELVTYAEPGRAAILAAFPDLPGEATGENWRKVLASTVERFGETISFPDALRGVLADDRSPAETLRDLGVPEDRIITLSPDGNLP